MRGTTWDLPFPLTFSGVLPTRLRLFPLTRLRGRNVGLRYLRIVWNRDA
jgi:hypothetical protein